MFRTVCLALALFLCGANAQAQPLALDRFNPAHAGDRFFATTSPDAVGDLGFHGEFVGVYSHNPLVVRTPDGDEIGAIVGQQVFLHLNAAMTVVDRLSLSIDTPIALAQSGDSPEGIDSPTGLDIGDIRLGVRGRLYGKRDGFFQLGVGTYLWLPSAAKETGFYVGNDKIRNKVYLAMSGAALRFLWGLEIGPEFRRSQEIFGFKQGSMLHASLANGVLLGQARRVQLSGELIGSIVLQDVDQQTTNFEALAGVKWRFTDDFVSGFALGPGLAPGIGTPAFRAAVSFAYTPLY